MRVQHEIWWLTGAASLAAAMAAGALWLVLQAGGESRVVGGVRVAPGEPTADSAVAILAAPTPADGAGASARALPAGREAFPAAGVASPEEPDAVPGSEKTDTETVPARPVTPASRGRSVPSVAGTAEVAALTPRPANPTYAGGRIGSGRTPQGTTSATQQLREREIDVVAAQAVAPPLTASMPATPTAPVASAPTADPTPAPRSEGPVAPPPRIDITTPAGRAARFVAHFPIGNSSRDGTRHRVGWNLPQDGWAGFVERRVMPQLDAGVRRVMLHNPFGHRPGVVMQFDQFLEAQEAGLTWLTEGFAEAWEPLTNAGIEVIAYVGSPAHDERSQAFEAAGDVEGFDVYARRCLQPLLDAGVSIAFDSAAIEPADTYTFRIAEWTRNRGVRTYIEPRPRKYLPHWFDYGIVTIYPFWLRTDPARFPEIADRHAANEDLTGDVIVIHNRPPQGSGWEEVAQWLPRDMQDIYGRNVSPAAPFTYWLRWGGEDLQSLLEPASETAFD